MPTAPTSAIASTLTKTVARCDPARVTGGREQDESPEWMPASSMCSITPPR